MKDDLNILAILPARGGSKRIPLKNIKEFCNQPMISWPISVLKASNYVNDIIVSTESKKIKVIAEQYGATVPFLRPAELADDQTGTKEVIKHATEWYVENKGKPDLILTIYPTAVFITETDIEKAIDLMRETDSTSIVACKEYNYPIQRAVFVNDHNKIEMFQPDYILTRTQDCEAAYHDAAQLYLSKVEQVLSGEDEFHNNSSMLIIPKHRAVDIDTPDDFEFAEQLFQIKLSKEKMNRIAIGTVQFGMPYGVANSDGQVDFNTASKIVSIAGENGIDTYDTSISYGDSEECLGKIGMKNKYVITKLPQIPEGITDIPDWIVSQVKSSLERLNVNKAYGLLLHDSSQIDELGKIFNKTFMDLKSDGLVEKIGLSAYTPEEIAKASTLIDLDIVQVPFNIIDRRLLETGWLNRLHDSGVEIHARSIFLQGLLLLRRENIPARFNKWKNLWNDWHNWLDNNNVSPLAACLHYPLSIPQIDKVIVGLDNIEHLNDLTQSFDQSNRPFIFPDISCDDEQLLNPSKWMQLN